MAKKKEKPAEEGSPAWMATFSDLMNLLLCFFVLLFASSTQDAEKIMRIVNSFNPQSYSILESGAVSLSEGQIISGGVTQLPGIESLLEYIGVSMEAKGNNDEISASGADKGEEDKDTSVEEPDEIVGTHSKIVEADSQSEQQETSEEELSEEDLKEKMDEKGLEQSESIYDEISELAESYDIDDRIVMDFNSQFVCLDLNGALLFDAGQADIRSDAKVFMQRIAAILERYKDCVIEIEGHTDNIPISSGKFESNRYLSTARANKVLEYIEEHADMIDSNMKAAGYGDTRPIASNATEEGRAKNRRVSIKIYNQLNSESQ